MLIISLLIMSHKNCPDPTMPQTLFTSCRCSRFCQWNTVPRKPTHVAYLQAKLQMRNDYPQLCENKTSKAQIRLIGRLITPSGNNQVRAIAETQWLNKWLQRARPNEPGCQFLTVYFPRRRSLEDVENCHLLTWTSREQCTPIHILITTH